MSFRSAKVISVEELGENIYRMKLKLMDDLGINPLPFQFIMVWIPRVKEVPMSISDYVSGLLTILFRVRGRGTEALSKTTGFIGVRGPYGRGLNLRRGERVLVIAGGVGIAPIPYLVRTALRTESSIGVLWGVRRASEVISENELFQGAKPSFFYVATEDCSSSYCGTAIDVAPKAISQGNWDRVILIGPPEMLREGCSKLIEIDPLVVLESIVKCGIGLCGTCSLKPLPTLLCVDGPLYRCSQVVDYLEHG
ncbi:MAG: dihydroorotate dehydrogenase [Desulfurococcaceae archaeon]